MHGFAWAWAAGWFWGWLIVAVALAPVVGRRLAGYDGRHVLPGVQEEYDAWVAGQGSMILAEEYPLEPLPAPTVDAEPWRQQITEELSPEALGEPVDWGIAQPLVDAIMSDEDGPEEIVLPAYGGWVSGPCLDPGPGDAAVEQPPASPGPDQPSRWLEGQMAILFDWVREQHARGALA